MDTGSVTAARRAGNLLQSLGYLLITICPILVVYLFFPTRNFYWDGVLFAIKIEEGSWRALGAMIHPNHLFYTLFGFFLYQPLHAVIPAVRALFILQVVNSLASVACSGLLLSTLMRATGASSRADQFVIQEQNVLLTWLFAFSATWWKFSVDADAYIISILFLLLSARALFFAKYRPLLQVAVFHVAAMLFHQLAVLFWIVVAIALLPRLQRLLIYTAATGIAIAMFYLLGYSMAANTSTSFFAWLTSHSNEVGFLFAPGQIASASAQSYVKLLFGGRIEYVRQFFDPVTATCLAVLIAALGFLISRFWGRSSDVIVFAGASNEALKSSLVARLCLIWSAFFALFLLFWLPWNTFYKLFFWPALIIYAGVSLSIYRKEQRTPQFRLRAFVVALVAWNFGFFIYPTSKAEAIPLVSFAERAGTVWPKDAKIFYSAFTPDNWFVRYFSPQTKWQPFYCANLADCRAQLSAQSQLWIDTTTMDFLAKHNYLANDWTDQLDKKNGVLELNDGKHRVQFIRFQSGILRPE